VARVLLVGCGCRGRELARALRGDGHAVRGTTRDPARCDDIAAAGAEPWVGDPDRVATLVGALEGVAIVCWLLGSARGDPAAVAALHDERLRFLLGELTDTGVRGFVYEAGGAVSAEARARGVAAVRGAAVTIRLPVALVDADPGEVGGWTEAMRSAVGGLLEERRTCHA
jgi:nucleoside-diphosphate-sugar epimerase